ncbi:MAG: hypothetical protein HYS32_03695 [Candidatus Woesearchaeota archaeon]|nr:MAG: hypothetical protein HYS32_03695 [Candidatus Woesearchaeota archaeon]
MVLKTFNIQEDAYNKFSKFCKEHGISMSKQVELFIESQVEDDKEVRPEYIKKLEKIKKGKYHKFNTVAELRRSIEK